MPKYGEDRGTNEELKIITVNIPRIYLSHIEKLRRKGIIPSRSEYVRWAIGNQITRDLERQKKIEELETELKELKVRVPKGWDYIPGFNGDKPFKTKPLILEDPEEKEVYY